VPLLAPGFSSGYLKHAKSIHPLYRAFWGAGDVAVNAYQGYTGFSDAYTQYRAGNYVSAAFSGIGGLFGVAGATVGARGLATTIREHAFLLHDTSNIASLLDDTAVQHVLRGDRWGIGGHYWFGGLRSFMHGITGKKSMFPIGWTKGQLLDSISDVVTDAQVMRLRNPRKVAQGATPEYFGQNVINGVEVGAFVRGSRIVSGYPMNSAYYARMKPVHQTWENLPG